jgi:hypothetical protein
VIVLGDEVKRLLFGDEEAVGQEVFVGRTPFTVVGIMAPKTQNSSYNARDQDRAFIPMTTYRVMEGSRHVDRTCSSGPRTRSSRPAVTVGCGTFWAGATPSTPATATRCPSGTRTR